MTDIEKAKKLLTDEEITFVMVNDQLIQRSSDRGIKPMFEHAFHQTELMKGASIADRVIGKAAALLAAYAGVSELYSPLVSQEAVKVCNVHGIKLEHDQVVDHIQNRTQTGLCPMEALSSNVTNPHEMLLKVKAFLAKIESSGNVV